MNLPKQVAPVERTLTPAAISGQSGVQASDTLDDVLKVVATVGGAAAPLVPLLASLI
jgi:hypothetical protein